MIRLFVLTLLVWTLSFSPSACNAEDAERPNFVFIIADDLGWADVGFHGGTVPTPHLDRLAGEGLELRQHYVAPVCSPTRAGLLTGRCWSRFGITTPTNTPALPTDTITLPRALRSVGYETCLIGKWHLGSKPEWGPNGFGFDHAYGSLAGGVSPWNHRYKQGPFSVTWHRNGELTEEAGHVTDLLTNEAITWISSRKKAASQTELNPFFLYVPFTAVHLPIKEPAEWLERVPAEIVGDVPRHYAACVMHLDDAVGRIIATLEASGLRENTLLVFTSDNGGSTAENNDLKYPDDHCPNGKLVGNNHPFRGQKGTLYEGGTRVPTVVSWPTRVGAGVCDDPVQIIDWMPTFTALAGYTPDRDLQWDGTDLSSLILEGRSLPARSLYTVGPQFRHRSLRHEEWKLIEYLDGERKRYELFHLAKDPSETTDLSAAEPERLRDLLRRLTEMSARDRDSVVE